MYFYQWLTLVYEWTKYKYLVWYSLYFPIYDQSKMAPVGPHLVGKNSISAWQSFTKIVIFWEYFVKLSCKSSWKMEFWECGIADRVSLWVTFDKSFIFCIFMLTYLFLDLKSSLKRQKCYYIYVLEYGSPVMLDLNF